MFNKAMLTKLSWRLRQDDNSLFLDAKESASASYAWRSILHGRDVILKGALWRVGDGKQIKIWGDNWLPTKFQPKVTSPMIFGQQNSSVEALINQLTRSQKNEVIDHCFNSTEAAVIKSIPLSSSPQPDKLIWPFTPTGQYFVKSGYIFLYERGSVQSPSSHSFSQPIGWW